MTKMLAVCVFLQEKRKTLAMRFDFRTCESQKKEINGLNTMGSKALIRNEKPCK